MEGDIRVCARWGFVCRRGGIGVFGFYVYTYVKCIEYFFEFH